MSDDTNKSDGPKKKSDGILRRDFLQGVAVTGAGILGAGMPLSKAIANSAVSGPDPSPLGQLARAGIDQQDPRYYPPALTGMRGSHPGSFQVAHQLRDEGGWTGPAGEDTGEAYDLVVVGAGISGLSAAYVYRKKKPDARILILDNHDDFGGHAKRNEFKSGDRTLIGYGGTQSMHSHYPASAISLLSEVGIDMRHFRKWFDVGLNERRNLQPGVYFNKAAFGKDVTVRGLVDFPQRELWNKAPVADQAKSDLHRVFAERHDYLPEMSRDEKLKYLTKISFTDFLEKHVKVHPDVIKYFHSIPSELTGLGSDATAAIVPIASANSYATYPLFLNPLTNLSEGMHLGLTPGDSYGYIAHFPDGNAGVARSFVRALIPEAVPGEGIESLVTARADYARLDKPGSPVRIRLNSPVVKVQHVGNPDSANQVDVTYVLHDKPYRVKAGNVVMACYNSIIPRLMPDLPKAQKEALLYPKKVPLVYTNVQIRNSHAFQKLGLSQIYCPNSLFFSICLDFPVSMGSYEAPKSPDEPCVLHLSCHLPAPTELPPRQQKQMARMYLYTTPFEKFEAALRDQLDRALGKGGFKSSRDIEGITINRWPHGYADGVHGLDDPEWAPGLSPVELGRKPFGRVAIANSDALGEASSGAAMEAAIMAVEALS